MSKAFVIAALPGAGKSTSIGNIPEIGIKGLDPKETVLINVMGKPLPFRDAEKYYKRVETAWDSGINRFVIKKAGNYLISKNPMEIINFLQELNKAEQVKNVIIDDFQYIISDEFMTKANVKGFDKFSSMAANAYFVMMAGLSMRDDIVFGVLTHSDPVMDGSAVIDYKIKTIGKLLDDKVSLEGLYSIMLFGDVVKNEEGKLHRVFVTNMTDKFRMAKSPIGMFDSEYIPNDLGLVVSKIREYYKN